MWLSKYNHLGGATGNMKFLASGDIPLSPYYSYHLLAINLYNYADEPFTF